MSRGAILAEQRWFLFSGGKLRSRKRQRLFVRGDCMLLMSSVSSIIMFRDSMKCSTRCRLLLMWLFREFIFVSYDFFEVLSWLVTDVSELRSSAKSESSGESSQLLRHVPSVYR